MANSTSNTASVLNTLNNTVSANITIGNYPVALGNYISSYVNTTGIASNSIINDGITIYPNPAKSTLTFHSQLSILNSQLIITDIMGNEVYKQAINGTDNSIDISNLSNGIYFYQVITDKKTIGGKFEVVK